MLTWLKRKVSPGWKSKSYIDSKVMGGSEVVITFPDPPLEEVEESTSTESSESERVSVSHLRRNLHTLPNPNLGLLDKMSSLKSVNSRKRSVSLPSIPLVSSERILRSHMSNPIDEIVCRLSDDLAEIQRKAIQSLRREGTHRGFYYNLGRISEGNSSQVYRCTDSNGKLYVCKTFRSAVGNRARTFEVAILRALVHPCIIRIYADGDPDPIFEPGERTARIIHFAQPSIVVNSIRSNAHISAYIMEEGVPLDIITRDVGLEDVTIYAYIADVCSALEYMHSLGLIHMDVKPNNIILTSTGAKLADFDGCVVGPLNLWTRKEDGINVQHTILFSSPEMIIGKKHITFEHDVWCIGTTLCNLLRYHHPFLGSVKSVEDKFNFETLEQHLKDLFLVGSPPKLPLRLYDQTQHSLLKSIFRYTPSLRWSCLQIKEYLISICPSTSPRY